jgi:hypothetical protein
VDPRAGLDDVEKILDPTETRTPTPLSSIPKILKKEEIFFPELKFISDYTASHIR